MKFLSEMF